MHYRHIIFMVLAILGSSTAVGAEEVPPANPFSCVVEFNNQVLPANQPQQAIVKISFDAPPPQQPDQRPAVNLCVVLDRSKSMSGVKLEQAKQGVLNLVRRLNTADLFSLVTCNNQVDTVISARNAGDTHAIVPAIEAIQAGGNTSLFGGLCQGAAEIRRNLEGNYVNRIILISDGVANRGPRSARELGRMGASLLKENIAVTTIGIGDHFNEDLMTQLAELSDGNTYYAHTAEKLPRILDQELDRLLNITANRVQVNVSCLDGVRPLRMIGRQGRVMGNRVAFDLNQLYGGQPNFALLEVAIPPGLAQEHRAVLKVQCDYEIPAIRQEFQTIAKGSIVYSDSPQEILRGNNKLVEADYNYNTLATAQETAIDLIEQGQQGQAVELLNDNVSTINAWAIANEAPALVKETEEVQQQLDQVEDTGLTVQQRKIWKSKSVQIRTQQIQPSKQ